jgi:hypothetical protein
MVRKCCTCRRSTVYCLRLFDGLFFIGFDVSDHASIPVSAFMYFGAKIDVGFPFNKHRAEDTGGWVGPINIVMAQDLNDGQGSRLTLSAPTATTTRR